MNPSSRLNRVQKPFKGHNASWEEREIDIKHFNVKDGLEVATLRARRVEQR